MPRARVRPSPGFARAPADPEPRSPGPIPFTVAQLRAMPQEARDRLIASLDAEELEFLKYWWEFHARPNQLPPEGDWITWLALAGRGWGKMLSVDTPIPTPDGWTTMGRLRVGDFVFDESGRPCRVSATYLPEIPERAYRLTFSDGSEVDACSDHQWVTWTHAERKAFSRSPYEEKGRFPADWPRWRLSRMLGKPGLDPSIVEEVLRLHTSGLSARKIARTLGVCRASIAKHLRAGEYRGRTPVVHADSPGPRVRTTEEIVRTLRVGTREDTNHCIPQCSPLVLPDANLPVPPYTLGAWLGDGSKHSGTITCHESDQPHVRREITLEGFATTDHCDPQNFGVLGLHALLRAANLLENKHVPKAYLRGSISQRLAILQGLMDTDGGVDFSSHVSFTNTNKDLADSVYELLISLGMRATRDERPAKLYDVPTGRTAYRVSFTPTMQVFRLPRKADAIRFGVSQGLRRHHRMIVDAERIESPGFMCCISVDSPSRMYLCGRGMIPTHNTRTGAETVRMWAAQPNTRIALVGATSDDVRAVMVEGEALALDTPIPVPEGWKNFGDLQVGDRVFARDGSITDVIAVSPTWESRPCFSVTADGSSAIVADARHKWVTSSRAERRPDRERKESIRSTEEMVGRVTWRRPDLYEYEIPMSGPLEGPILDLPVPPYTLGAWLGDGDTRGHGTFTCHDSDVETIDRIRADGFRVGRRVDSCAWGILGLRKKLREAGVLGDKFIPDIYLRAHADQRVELLRGLMDTDGYVSSRGQCAFDNTNFLLVSRVRELLLTLGFKPGSIRAKPDRRGHKTMYRITFTCTSKTPNPFHLARKSDRCLASRRPNGRLIRSIEPVDSVPVRCIQVAHASGTFLAGEDMVVTHNSGILAISPPWFMPKYQSALRRLTWPNGSIGTLYSAEEPKRLRGPQHHKYWADELAAWEYMDTFDQLMFGLRLGQNPQGIVTTTPQPLPIIRDLLARPTTRVSEGSTYENKHNLAAAFLDQVLLKYEGTRLGRQEIYGKLLGDTPGALWTEATIEAGRAAPMGRDASNLPYLPGEVAIYRVAIGVDPAGKVGDMARVAEGKPVSGHSRGGDEAGVVVGGLGDNGHGYVLEDCSTEGSPRAWGDAAVAAYARYNADVIVVEYNHGGEEAEKVILKCAEDRGVRVNVKRVWASKGKYTRAEPISALYEQRRVHHVGLFDDLEDEMTTFVPGCKSPNRLDAAVFALTELMLESAGPGKSAAGGERRADVPLFGGS